MEPGSKVYQPGLEPTLWPWHSIVFCIIPVLVYVLPKRALVHFFNGCSGHEWTRTKLEPWASSGSSTWLKGSKDLVNLPVLCQAINREVDGLVRTRPGTHVGLSALQNCRRELNHLSQCTAQNELNCIYIYIYDLVLINSTLFFMIKSVGQLLNQVLGQTLLPIL